MSGGLLPDSSVPVATPLPTLHIESIIPPELLTRCLDFLGLADILRVMATNSRLNVLGRDHPKYWRDLSLNLSRDRAAEQIRFFRLRLSRSQGRPIKISTTHRGHTPSDHTFHFAAVTAERDLLPDISSHLYHTQSLMWDLRDHTILEQFFDALAHPAPMLQTFVLSCLFWMAPHSRVRADLLGGFAPALRSASFSYLELPVPLPPCLSQISRLRIQNATVPDLSQACPHLRALYLCDNVPLHQVFLTTATWDHIQRLDLIGKPIARDWRTMGLPINSVRKVTVELNYMYASEHAGVADCLDGLAAHLEGTIGLTVVATNVLSFHLRSMSGRTRHRLERSMLTKQTSTHRTPQPPLTNVVAGFAHRIVYLAVRLKSWGSTQRLGPLPALRDLVLVVADESILQSSAQLSCPAIRRVVVSQKGWRADVRVMAMASLAQFARLALLDARFPLALELQGARLQVDAECDPATFRGPVTTSAPDDVRSL